MVHLPQHGTPLRRRDLFAQPACGPLRHKCRLQVAPGARHSVLDRLTAPGWLPQGAHSNAAMPVPRPHPVHNVIQVGNDALHRRLRVLQQRRRPRKHSAQYAPPHGPPHSRRCRRGATHLPPAAPDLGGCPCRSGLRPTCSRRKSSGTVPSPRSPISSSQRLQQQSQGVPGWRGANRVHGCTALLGSPNVRAAAAGAAPAGVCLALLKPGCVGTPCDRQATTLTQCSPPVP